MSQQPPYGSAPPNNEPMIAQIDDDFSYMTQSPPMPIPQHHTASYGAAEVYHLSALMEHQSSLSVPSFSQQQPSESLWSSHPPLITTPEGGNDEVPTISIQRSASPAMPYHDLYEPHSPNPGLVPPGTPSEEGGHSPAFNPSMLWPLSVGDYRSIPSPDGHSPTSVISEQLYLSPTNTSPHSPFSPPSPFSPDHSMITSPDDFLQPGLNLGRSRSASDPHLNLDFAFPQNQHTIPHPVPAHRVSDPSMGMLLSPVSEDPHSGNNHHHGGGAGSTLARRHSTTSRQYTQRHRYTSSEPIAQAAGGAPVGSPDLLTPDYGLHFQRGEHSMRGRLSHRPSSSSSSGGIGAMRTPGSSSRGTSPYSRDASPSGSEYSYGGYASDVGPPQSPSVVTKPVVTTDPIAEASSKRRTHEARFECDICHKKLTTKTNLDGHRNSHLGVKEFKCQFCEKYFTRDWDRKRHEKTHEKKPSMTCNLCGKSSSRKDALANHRCRRQDGDSNENSNGEEDKGEGSSGTR